MKARKHTKSRSLHDRIIIAINYLVVTVALVAACAVDSETLIPMIISICCMAWFILFIYANGRD